MWLEGKQLPQMLWSSIANWSCCGLPLASVTCSSSLLHFGFGISTYCVVSVFKLFLLDLDVLIELALWINIDGTNASSLGSSDFAPPTKCTEQRRVLSVGVKFSRLIRCNQALLRLSSFGIL